MCIKSKFKIYASISKSNELNEDGTLTLEGIASTTNTDLQGDVVSQQALESMKEHATKLNIHANHNYDLFDGVIGHIIEVLDSDNNTLKIKFVILAEYAERIKSMLDLGIKLGLSIGGDVTDWKEQETPDGGFVWIIEDIILFEISLTPMPANWDTFSTVTTSKGLVKSKCLAGACYEVIKNNGENMKKYLKIKAEESSEESEGTEMTEAKVTDMINEALNNFKDEEIPTIIEEIKSDIKQEVLDELKQEETPEESESTENEGSVESEKGLSPEELEKQISKNIEESIFKKLGVEREPESSEPDADEIDPEETSKNLKMSRKDIAKNLAESRSQTGLAAIIQQIKGE